jgi:hypothetical protein
MSYWDIAQMSADLDLTSRVAACAAQEGADNPRQWAADNMLTVAAAPGWGEAWASAIAGGNEFPGRDPAVITDPQILAEVQAELGAGAGG